MDPQEIAARIARFPAWHYDFDLQGQRTNPEKAEWGELRAFHFIEPVVRHFGGSLEGKRVLDLGCNAGFFSLKAIEAGCDYVLGIDGREMHVDQANFVFEVKDIDPSRYEFACGNILDFDYQKAGPFDIVLCLGVLYHINQPIALFKAIAPVNTDLLVIDTKLSAARGSWIELRRDSLSTFLDAVDYELVMVPTAKAVIVMVQLFGYEAKMLALRTPDEPSMWKYRDGVFKTFVCAKTSDLSMTKAFEFQSMKSLYAEQEQASKSASWQAKKSARTVRGWRRPTSLIYARFRSS